MAMSMTGFYYELTSDSDSSCYEKHDFAFLSLNLLVWCNCYSVALYHFFVLFPFVFLFIIYTEDIQAIEKSSGALRALTTTNVVYYNITPTNPSQNYQFHKEISIFFVFRYIYVYIYIQQLLDILFFML